MFWIFELLSYLVKSLFYRQAAKRAKAQGVLIYLKTLQVTRLSLMGLLAIFSLLQILLLGFVGAVITGVWLLPQETAVKIWILFGVFTLFFILTVAFLIFMFSEKVWYRLSGAEDMVKRNSAGL